MDKKTMQLVISTQAKRIEALEKEVAKLRAAAKKCAKKKHSSGGASAKPTVAKPKRVTTTPKPTECGTCKVMFPSKKAANDHWSDKSNPCRRPRKPKPGMCSICKKEFPDLWKHLNMDSQKCKTSSKPS